MTIEPPPSVVDAVYEPTYARAYQRLGLASLLAGAAALLFALAVLLWVLWLMLSSVKATPFDADGVRCYRAASELACIKTAEPAR
jgi:hypothetical protein